MKTKSSWKSLLAVLVGFVLGAWMFHAPTVKAQYGGATVTVQQVPVLGLRSTLNTGGSQVVGFSCVQTDRETECYVASVR
jgi:hypothetical protein